MRRLKIRGERIAALSLVVMMLFLITIGKENGALEFYPDNDNLPVDELTNGDEDDEKDFNFPFSEETSTYTSNTLSSDTRKRDKCNEDQLMLYLAEIQVINPETILQIASYKDFEPVCRKIGASLESIDGWMLTCHPPPVNNLYMRLMAGVRVLENKLCTPSEYQLAFKKYMVCYQQLHYEYIDCTGPADWIVDMEDQELCDEYKVIADCYYMQTAMLCGIKAAKTLKELVVRVINAVIQIHCPEIRKNPLVPDPMPEHSVYARKSSSGKIQPNYRLYTLLLLFTYLLIRTGN